MVTLGAKPGWREILPEGLPEMSEALLVNSGALPFTKHALRLARGPLAVGMADLGETLQPGIFEGIGRRKIFMNEQVLEAIEAGATQVLVVGAGFDTLGLRLAGEYPDILFMEIDHPDTSRAKSRALHRIGQPDNLVTVAEDLSQHSLSQVLEDTGSWDAKVRSVAVAEGLLYYLNFEAVAMLFHELRASMAKGSHVAFSHLFDGSSYRLARVALRFGGEPWLSHADSEDLPDYIGAGWRVLKTRAGARYRDLESLALVERR